MAGLFYDIDGTLISEKTKQIPESARKALLMAQAKGHKVFINTGRTICSVPENVRAIPSSGILCGCGTRLIYEDEVVFSHAIPEEEGYAIVDQMKKHRVEGFLEGSEDVYFSNQVARKERLESSKRYMASLGLGVETAIEDKNYVYDKILIYADELADTEGFFEAVKSRLQPIDRTEGVYEMVQKDYSKATAIEYMQHFLGLSMDEIYVFGDSSNDMSMFEYATHTVAMKVHDPVLDPHTEYVTDTVENDGIYKAMEHYGLI